MPKIFHLITVGVLVFTAGCASSSARVSYHLLHPAVSPSVEAGSWDASVYVVVGPVGLPSYLDRPQMVVRRSDHTLAVSEYQRWAEPLHEGIARAVAENISRLTGARKVFLHPFDVPRGEASLQVFLDVVRFDTDDSGRAVLDVRWGVKKGREKTVVIKQTTLGGEVDGMGQPARADALSRLLAEFSREVAGSLL